MKKFRVDIFGDKGKITRYYENEDDARASVKPIEVAFLLELNEAVGKYEVIEAI